MYSKLYDGARLTVEEFSIVFMSTINKIGVAKNQIDPILDLVRLVLPSDNELPTSFNIMQSFIDTSGLLSMHQICKVCNKELINGSKTCINTECVNNKLIKKTVKVFQSNIEEQIKIIFSNHLPSMLRYKGKVMTKI